MDDRFPLAQSLAAGELEIHIQTAAGYLFLKGVVCHAGAGSYPAGAEANYHLRLSHSSFSCIA